MFEILPEFRTVPVANDVYMLAVLPGTQTERHTHDSEAPRTGLTSGHRVFFLYPKETCDFYLPIVSPVVICEPNGQAVAVS